MIRLVVTDSLGLASEPEFVVVSTQNSAPVAEAGEDQYFENPDITIQLDGSQSFDPDGDTITYAWAIIIKPQDSVAELTN